MEKTQNFTEGQIFEFNRIAEGRQMLLELNLSDFDYVQLFEALFGGEITYVGYPMENGKVGSSFGISDGMAMTNACKDKAGAWSFMREILLPESEATEYFYSWRFPINKVDFMAVVDQAMEKQYLVDEETSMYFNGDKSVEETAKVIQSRVNIYVNEQM